MSTDLWRLPANEAGALIAAGLLSPVELTEALLQRIDDLNPHLNAFLTVTPERARRDAKEAETRALNGERLGPLDGVPHSVKDLEPTAGIRTTGGSLWNKDHVPDHDSLVAARLRATGSPLLGKTNTPQAGYKDMTDNLLGPPARNPWDLTRTPGGSSGGAAAAVAAGLGPLAQGGDGAGSVRIPAAHCGVVGFKPSNGLIPKWPSNDWYATLATAGPLTTTVTDAALMLNALAGPDRRDPQSIDREPPDFVAACRGSVRGLRVAWSPDLGHATVAPDVAEATRRAALVFERLGASVEEVPIGWGTLAREIIEPTWGIHFVARFAEKAEERPDWIEPSLLAFVQDGHARSALEYRRLLARRAELYDRVRQLFDTYDLLLTPTVPITAWPAEGEPEIPLFERLPFTYPFNLTGHPAASVPCGLDGGGLPVGLQIVADRHRDDRVMAAAARFEEAQPWTAHAPHPGRPR
ncbi:amidase [Actinomadura madurae]|uniref:amidase n=1 Tax=Actinomadura madurae TaxID=1993 RepID=UPI000D9A2803|nr:amidase family protein [Actinomadura madurae]SPT59108.1 Glutamyl-tRNA(Gln) amidotransferase subunit A [Actinomadura madurae]